MSVQTDYYIPQMEKMEAQISLQASEIARLRKGIQDYLDGNFGPDFPTKHDQCPHKRFGWEDCGQCIDEYFTSLLSPPDRGSHALDKPTTD